MLPEITLCHFEHCSAQCGVITNKARVIVILLEDSCLPLVFGLPRGFVARLFVSLLIVVDRTIVYDTTVFIISSSVALIVMGWFFGRPCLLLAMDIVEVLF
jgi:hypothetical protein